MLGRGILALLVAVASGYVLFKDAGSPAPPAKAQARPPVLTLDGPVGGTLYFAAVRPRPNGGVAEEESVYRLGPDDRRPVRVLPRNPRTWHVSAWGANVVLNTDGDSLMAPAGAVTLDGRVIAGDAHTPAAGPRGRIAYSGFVENRSISAAFVRWSRRGRFRPIARRGIWSMAFLPDGRLVVVQRRQARARILVIGPGGIERDFGVPGNPQYDTHVTSAGLIAFEGGTGRLRLYTASGRRRATHDVEGWWPAGTRGRDVVLVEKDGDRIATLSPSGDLEVVGRHDPAYEIHRVEWETR